MTGAKRMIATRNGALWSKTVVFEVGRHFSALLGRSSNWESLAD